MIGQSLTHGTDPISRMLIIQSNPWKTRLQYAEDTYIRYPVSELNNIFKVLTEVTKCQLVSNFQTIPAFHPFWARIKKTKAFVWCCSQPITRAFIVHTVRDVCWQFLQAKMSPKSSKVWLYCTPVASGKKINSINGTIRTNIDLTIFAETEMFLSMNSETESRLLMCDYNLTPKVHNYRMRLWSLTQRQQTCGYCMCKCMAEHKCGLNPGSSVNSGTPMNSAWRYWRKMPTYVCPKGGEECSC